MQVISKNEMLYIQGVLSDVNSSLGYEYLDEAQEFIHDKLENYDVIAASHEDDLTNAT